MRAVRNGAKCGLAYMEQEASVSAAIAREQNPDAALIEVTVPLKVAASLVFLFPAAAVTEAALMEAILERIEFAQRILDDRSELAAGVVFTLHGHGAPEIAHRQQEQS